MQPSSCYELRELLSFMELHCHRWIRWNPISLGWLVVQKSAPMPKLQISFQDRREQRLSYQIRHKQVHSSQKVQFQSLFSSVVLIIQTMTRDDFLLNIYRLQYPWSRGYFSGEHSNTECSVLEEYYVIDKYKGYCKCEKCISTALLKGKDKPQKLRKLYQDS